MCGVCARVAGRPRGPPRRLLPTRTPHTHTHHSHRTANAVTDPSATAALSHGPVAGARDASRRFVVESASRTSSRYSRRFVVDAATQNLPWQVQAWRGWWWWGFLNGCGGVLLRACTTRPDRSLWSVADFIPPPSPTPFASPPLPLPLPLPHTPIPLPPPLPLPLPLRAPLPRPLPLPPSYPYTTWSALGWVLRVQRASKNTMRLETEVRERAREID